MIALGLVGQDTERYGGLGFGNLSSRIGTGFIVTASQTGHLPDLSSGDFSEIVEWNIDRNFVYARGESKPSSESLTHAAVYQVSDRARSVIHVHSPLIWSNGDKLGIPSTDWRSAYGTPEMAEEVMQIVGNNVPNGVLVMKGHEDGVLSWGDSLAVAGSRLLHLLSEARLNKV